MEHVFCKINKFIPVKNFSLYLVIAVLFPVLLKLVKVSDEVMAMVYTFNVNITSSIFLLVILIKNFIELFKYGLSEQEHRHNKRCLKK